MADRLLISERLLRRWPKEAETIVQLALDTGSQLRHLSGAAGDRLDRVSDGIAARLRFPVLVPSTKARQEAHVTG